MANVHSADPDSKKPVIAFNLVFQFLFHELRNSSRVRKWFYRKLTVELDELITKTTTGKFFDKLTVTRHYFIFSITKKNNSNNSNSNRSETSTLDHNFRK